MSVHVAPLFVVTFVACFFFFFAVLFFPLPFAIPTDSLSDLSSGGLASPIVLFSVECRLLPLDSRAMHRLKRRHMQQDESGASSSRGTLYIETSHHVSIRMIRHTSNAAAVVTVPVSLLMVMMAMAACCASGQLDTVIPLTECGGCISFELIQTDALSLTPTADLRARCQAKFHDGVKGDACIVRSAALNARITAAAADAPWPQTGYNVLLGASDAADDGTWKWVSGEIFYTAGSGCTPYSYCNFAPSQPSNSSFGPLTENNMRLQPDDGKWDDVTVRPFGCCMYVRTPAVLNTNVSVGSTPFRNARGSVLFEVMVFARHHTYADANASCKTVPHVIDPATGLTAEPTLAVVRSARQNAALRGARSSSDVPLHTVSTPTAPVSALQQFGVWLGASQITPGGAMS